ncbi:phosphatase PAP2 family protein [Nonomuraea sediminis]|uniref:phosphatase PAP2 family protein n=1 Tax=Nonomuraea sediminis TaxID=2835864 RepID=UPI001BDCD204|nr:phosphatase PAP2 family protein [Nonomuraea sediminis]
MNLTWAAPRRGPAVTTLVTVLMIWDRTYLGAHWLSDTAAGGLLLWRAFAPALAKEQAKRLT